MLKKRAFFIALSLLLVFAIVVPALALAACPTTSRCGVTLSPPDTQGCGMFGQQTNSFQQLIDQLMGAGFFGSEQAKAVMARLQEYLSPGTDGCTGCCEQNQSGCSQGDCGPAGCIQGSCSQDSCGLSGLLSGFGHGSPGSAGCSQGSCGYGF